MRPLTRRRFVAIAAAAAGLGLAAAGRDPNAYRWTGTALGADASVSLAGHGRDVADRAVAATLAEIERLEQAFSLYRPDSELSRLNRDGRLDRPSHDFRLLLADSLAAWERTEGAFNPAVQPLWQCLARHFAGPDRDRAPDPAELAAARARCDPAAIEVTARGVRLAPGMALTFNGIAQGYVTDAVAALLEAAGYRDVLLDLGEIRALPGRSWQVAVAGTGRRLALAGRAVAHSAGRGTPFSRDGRWHHLIDPVTGMSANRLAAVTVVAPTATAADALSTALFVAPRARHAAIAARFAGVTAYVEESA